MDNKGSIPSGGREYYHHHHIQTGSRAQPASYPMAIRSSSPVAKLDGCRTKHTPQSYAQVNPLSATVNNKNMFEKCLEILLKIGGSHNKLAMNDFL